jgi:hypothetical protein
MVQLNLDFGSYYHSPYEEYDRTDEDMEEIVLGGKTRRRPGRKPTKDKREKWQKKNRTRETTYTFQI